MLGQTTFPHRGISEGDHHAARPPDRDRGFVEMRRPGAGHARAVGTLLDERNAPPPWAGISGGSQVDGGEAPPPSIRPLSQGSGGWLRRLWPVWWTHRRVIVVALVSAIVAMCAQQATPLFQRYAIDHDIIGGRRSGLPLVLSCMAGLFAVRFVAGWTRRYFGGRIAWEVDYDLRNAVFSHLQGLDFARHDEMPTGQLVSRTNSDLTLMRQLLAQVPTVLSNLLQFLLALGIMLYLSPLLTLAVMPIIPLLFLLAFRMRLVVYPSQWEAQARMAEMVGVVDDSVTGARVVRGFGQEDRELSRVIRALGSLFGSRMRNLRLRARRSSTLQAIPQIGQAVILGFGGWLAFRGPSHGGISVGTLLAFFTYLTQLAAPARQMANLLVTAQQARAGAERVLELLDSLPDVSEKHQAVVLPPSAGRISFDDVSFGYLASEPVLHHFSLEIPSGGTVALVGGSGSGKSTIALLLPRFYDVQRGAVRIDGIDVRDVTFDSLRRQIGVVFEDAFLFSDTVRSNIAYGRPDATDGEIVTAARAAEAHEFIEALPDGYDTVVGVRGLLLSGGQRQRITLARALLTDPRILLLDDATSSIDARVEQEIHATLRRLMVGRSTILVAHRRSTLRLAERIVVLEHGHVVDAGSHGELMERSALYRELLAGPGEELVGDVELEEVAAEATSDAWQRPQGEFDLGGERLDVARVTALAGQRVAQGRVVVAAGAGVARGGGGGNRAALAAPPTEKLLRQIAALPPVEDEPDIDLGRETRPDPRPFRFGAYLGPYWPQLLLGALFVFLDAMAGLVGPSLSGNAISHGIRLHREELLWVLAAVYLVVQLGDWAFMWAETFWTGRVSERLLYAMRAKIAAHLQRLGVDFYDREMTGRILTRITSDVDTLSQLLQAGLVNAFVNGVSFAGVAVILCVLDLRLALVVLCVIPPLAVATVMYQKKSRRAYDCQRDRIAAVNADLQENVSGVRVTQAFRRERRNTANFLELVADYRDAGVRSQWLQSIYFSFAELAGNIGILLVLGVGSSIVFSAHGPGAQAVALGVLATFLLYLTQLFAPVQQLSQVFDTYQQASAGIRRIAGLLNTTVSTPVPEHPVPVGRVRGEVRLEAVHFTYPNTTTEALAGVDLTVAPGETVALVGETGAGKSTVVKLVARFYDPTAGRVLVDGIPLTEIDLGSYRRQLGYVPQEPFLFAGTIRDNIAYGRFDATNAEVEAAARAVGAHEMIVGSGGYLKHLSERGRSLSIGQRQLLCLARALLVDPAILLLDEATSNLDLSTEARVTRAMGVVARGRTTIVIAHRLQTAQRADRIVVVDHGAFVESGTHDELVAAGGRYASMWSAFEDGPAA